MITTCRRCADAEPDSGLCFNCTKMLRHLLWNAAWLSKEIEIDLTRLSQSGDPYRDGGRSTETLLVFDDAASEAAWILGNTITAWANDLSHCGKVLPFFQVETTETLANWMADHVIELAKLPGSRDFVSELDSAMSEVVRIIDRGPSRIYLADCGACGHPVHGTTDDVAVQCHFCGNSIVVADARKANQAIGRDVLVTASEAQLWLGEVYGKQVTARRIRVWAHRGKLPKHGDRYRVGDILELLLP